MRQVQLFWQRRLRRIVVLHVIAVFFMLGFLYSSEPYRNKTTGWEPQLDHTARVSGSSNIERTSFRNVTTAHSSTKPTVLPILVIACNRPSVTRTLNALLDLRKRWNKEEYFQFPITVSQGCDHRETADIIETFGEQISVIRFTGDSHLPKEKYNLKKLAYRSIAHHYKFALNYMFLVRNHSAVIVVEDDLDIAPDFLDYFAATLPLLKADRRLFCVTAWNDNGRPHLINLGRNDLIYRTDFFSGLGWMLLRQFWLEIVKDWPDIYWDEYLRKPYVRQNRSCLRPELGRTTTFGRVGVSSGQYFKEYLRTMHLNRVPYDFTKADLSYLREPSYTRRWIKQVYKDAQHIHLPDLLKNHLPDLGPDISLRVTYNSLKEFTRIARHLNLMFDIKSGVLRTAFRGVVPAYWKHCQLFIAPPQNWTGYNASWG
ncbi:Alpha-1 3-mannosyl-glycoprotein beta-1 2-N-acetylglucosaminyltransferase [Paragonimus heterotremus]|uniref:Alpha-1,3-mannosyl-glycoprotein 2-beta-N-acetylglucosaminyltransferase n=1 Tax=Paragonimus heterotremus TaxID=100268 RepID=A0A8J4WFU1_9TREM|nr:Alpha-1 3-mannosyl-glycoprotein beta-1 2-N-acetylglucosaminyltransferase [Paragonimus heterotremus]